MELFKAVCLVGCILAWHNILLFVTAEWAVYNSGQIIATSHDLTPNGGLVRDIPLFQGNLVKYYNLAR